MYLCVVMCLRQLLWWRLANYWGAWPLLELRVKAGLSCGSAENRKTSNVVYAIASPLASILEDLYSFTCCPDSSVVERHLGKMEVPGSIPGRGSLINSCESTY